MNVADPTTARRERGRYAALRRSRRPDDPELIEARRRMREEATVAALERALKNAPPLTADMRRRINELLTNSRAQA